MNLQEQKLQDKLFYLQQRLFENEKFIKFQKEISENQFTFFQNIKRIYVCLIEYINKLSQCAFEICQSIIVYYCKNIDIKPQIDKTYFEHFQSLIQAFIIYVVDSKMLQIPECFFLPNIFKCKKNEIILHSENHKQFFFENIECQLKFIQKGVFFIQEFLKTNNYIKQEDLELSVDKKDQKKSCRKIKTQQDQEMENILYQTSIKLNFNQQSSYSLLSLNKQKTQKIQRNLFLNPMNIIPDIDREYLQLYIQMCHRFQQIIKEKKFKNQLNYKNLLNKNKSIQDSLLEYKNDYTQYEIRKEKSIENRINQILKEKKIESINYINSQALNIKLKNKCIILKTQHKQIQDQITIKQKLFQNENIDQKLNLNPPIYNQYLPPHKPKNPQIISSFDFKQLYEKQKKSYTLRSNTINQLKENYLNEKIFKSVITQPKIPIKPQNLDIDTQENIRILINSKKGVEKQKFLNYLENNQKIKNYQKQIYFNQTFQHKFDFILKDQ